MTELCRITNYTDRRDAAIAHVERGRLEHIATIDTEGAGQAVDFRRAQEPVLTYTFDAAR